MKRIVSLICLICVAVSALCLPVSAEDQQSSVFLEISSINNTELVLDLCVQDSQGLGIKSFGVYLTYSSTATFVGCDGVPAVGSIVTDPFSFPGLPYQIIWTGNEPLGSEKVTVAKLTFLTSVPVDEAVFQVKLALDFDNLPKDANGNAINSAIKISGVNIGGETPPTPPTPPLDEGVPGDADDNSKVNISDVSLILKYIAKWNVTLNEDNADVNADSKINLSDVSLILKYIAKWDVELK